MFPWRHPGSWPCAVIALVRIELEIGPGRWECLTFDASAPFLFVPRRGAMLRYVVITDGVVVFIVGWCLSEKREVGVGQDRLRDGTSAQ